MDSAPLFRMADTLTAGSITVVRGETGGNHRLAINIATSAVNMEVSLVEIGSHVAGGESPCRPQAVQFGVHGRYAAAYPAGALM